MGIQIRILKLVVINITLAMLCLSPTLFAEKWFYTINEEDILLTEFKSQFQALKDQKEYQKAWQFLDQSESQYHETLVQKHEDTFIHSSSYEFASLDQWIRSNRLNLLPWSFPLKQSIIDDKKQKLLYCIRSLEEFNLWHHNEEDGVRYWTSIQPVNDPEFDAKKQFWLHKMVSFEDGHIDFLLDDEPFFYLTGISFGTPVQMTSYYAGLGDVIALHGCEAAIPFWKKALEYWDKTPLETNRSSLKELGWDKLSLIMKLGLCYKESGNNAELTAVYQNELIFDGIFTTQDFLRKQDEIIHDLKPKTNKTEKNVGDFTLENLTRWCQNSQCYDANNNRLFISLPFAHRAKIYILSMDSQRKIYLDVYNRFNQKLSRQFYIGTYELANDVACSIELQKGIIVARLKASSFYLFLDPLRQEILPQNALELSSKKASLAHSNAPYFLTALYLFNVLPFNFYSDVQWQRLITDPHLKSAIIQAFINYNFADDGHRDRSLLLAKQLVNSENLKQMVVGYLSHTDPEIRKKAIRNWRFISNDVHPFFLALTDSDPSVIDISLKELATVTLTTDQILQHLDFLKTSIHSSDYPNLQLYSIEKLTSLAALETVFPYMIDEIFMKTSTSDIEKQIFDIAIRNLSAKITVNNIPQVLDQLTVCLSSPEAKVRIWALETLYTKKIDLDTLTLFGQHLQSEKNPEVLLKTISVINGFSLAHVTSPDAFTAVIQMLDQNTVTKDIKMEILNTLSLYPSTPQTYEVLFEISNDADPEIKNLADRTLRSGTNTEVLMSLLNDPKQSRLYIPIIQILGYIGNTQIIPVLLDLLTKKNSLDIRMAALWALFRIDHWDKTVLQALGELAVSEKYVPLRKDVLKILCLRSDYFHYAVYLLFVFENEPELFKDSSLFESFFECIERLSRKTPLTMARLKEIADNHRMEMDIPSAEIITIYQKIVRRFPIQKSE